jgi:hypothetical protein
MLTAYRFHKIRKFIVQPNYNKLFNKDHKPWRPFSAEYLTATSASQMLFLAEILAH